MQNRKKLLQSNQVSCINKRVGAITHNMILPDVEGIIYYRWRSSMSNYDYLVFIGRFRPFTLAHLEVIRAALKEADNLIMIVGSSFSPRTTRNPFTFNEVNDMISLSLNPDERRRVHITPLADFMYADHLWVEQTQKIVGMYAGENSKVGLIGHQKDYSSYYLKIFPMWSNVNVANYRGINATAARNGYFSNISKEWLHAAEDMLPTAVIEYLSKWRDGEAFADMMEEYDFIRQYHIEWGKGPHMTADAIAIQANHILMVKRGNRPGKGLWAFPGGFLDIDKSETLAEAAIRELKEETNINIPNGALHGSMKLSRVFDSPDRDPRGRIITSAHLIDLDHEVTRSLNKTGTAGLTEIKPGSDAAHAEWVPLSSLSSETMFADHWHILRAMMNAYKAN